jgi:hypothetical protein
MGLEDADHVVEVEKDHEGRDKEEEPAHPHPGIHQDRRCFVLLVHVLLVVDVVSCHLEDKGVVCAATTKAVEAL